MDIENQLNDLLEEGEIVLATQYRVSGVAMPLKVDTSAFSAWRTKILVLLDVLPRDIVKRYIDDLEGRNGCYYRDAVVIQGILKGLKESIESGVVTFAVQEKEDSVCDLDTIILLCKRFHKVARSLRNRHDKRETLVIKDEYDVQDLFGSLLRLYFDDVRREEYVPSYAGGASRTDFLLLNSGIVVEIKKTRDSMKDSDLGEQLIIDLERYKAHPQCNYIVCFVYDPDELLGNPEGIMGDLNRAHEGEALIIIEP